MKLMELEILKVEKHNEDQVDGLAKTGNDLKPH